jgi:uncharacterized protein (TIGR03435 family)
MVASVVFASSADMWAQGTVAGEKKEAMMAKGADPDWEVVTVKPGDPYAKSDHIDLHGRHLTLENETVEIMMLLGYQMQKNQIAGVPEWAKTERWTVDGLADVDGEPNVSQLQTMVRKVLMKRFGLKAHREQRQMPVFALTVAKGRPKMTINTSDPNGLPDQHGSHGVGWVMYHYKNTSMPELALMLLSSVDRPIVDRTGLTERYDLQLKWTTDDAHATDPDAPPGLFTAIQEQVGLKLEPVKAMADVLVIDKVERPEGN